MQIPNRLLVFAATLALLGLALSGCDDKRRHGAGQEVAFGEVKAPVGADATPLEVGRAFLSAVRDAQRTRAGGLGGGKAKDAYDDAIARMQSLAARDAIYKQVTNSGSASIPPDVSASAALTLVCESWISMVAHYVDGFDLEQLTQLTQDPTDYATVYLQAANPDEEKYVDELRNARNNTGGKDEAGFRKELLAEGINPRLRVGIDVRLKRVDAGWRVLSVTIGPGRTTTWPPAPPASQPAQS